ncbi:MAG: hypothetical protein HUU14_01920 [Dehalococcoidia bacterium]|nr:hypothetical protein [Dehalococcoidia bacterium]NUQ54626.1 hypothetical protein [Dehalococcoidia bacterium]
MRAAIFTLCAAFILFWSTLLAAEVQAAPPDKEPPPPARTPQPADDPGSAGGSTAARTGVKLIIHKRVWNQDSETWKPATPAHSWVFEVVDVNGNVAGKVTDEDTMPLEAGEYTVAEKPSPPNPEGFAIFDFVKSAKGGANCPDDPQGGNSTVTITREDFEENAGGTIHLCAYNRGREPSEDPSTGPSERPRTTPKPEKARSVIPLLVCVADQGGGAYTAYFGYANENGAPVKIEPGEQNSLDPAVPGVTPPYLFQPGRTDSFPDAAFTADFNGKALTWTLKGPDGRTNSATADVSSKACPKPKLIKEFVSEGPGFVTWRLRPSFDVDMVVWDSFAETCTAAGGAACGGITSGDYGKFYATGSGQYIEITQSYTVKDGKKCEVRNVAEYATAPFTNPLSATDKAHAKYRCSGANAMGWPLLGLAFVAAIAATWAVQRKRS